jgi:hypothetical protein
MLNGFRCFSSDSQEPKYQASYVDAVAFQDQNYTSGLRALILTIREKRNLEGRRLQTEFISIQLLMVTLALGSKVLLSAYSSKYSQLC